MKCEEIMKRAVECVSPEDGADVAARRMRDENIGFLPVCDESMKVVGTITDRDIVLRVVAEGEPNSTLIESVMTHEVVAIQPDQEIDEALRLMADKHKSRIMCVDDEGVLCGVISLSDIAQQDHESAAGTLRQVTERETRYA